MGLTESRAQAKGLKFKVRSDNTPSWYTARRLAERVYGYNTLVEEGTGQILGAHIVGPHADEVINLFGHAIRQNLTAGDLQRIMFAYPTGASDIGYRFRSLCRASIQNIEHRAVGDSGSIERPFPPGRIQA